ncbi:hypothetical protein B0H16DRAFT_1901658, partial [Mycena metata]
MLYLAVLTSNLGRQYTHVKAKGRTNHGSRSTSALETFLPRYTLPHFHSIPRRYSFCALSVCALSVALRIPRCTDPAPRGRGTPALDVP